MSNKIFSSIQVIVIFFTTIHSYDEEGRIKKNNFSLKLGAPNLLGLHYDRNLEYLDSHSSVGGNLTFIPINGSNKATSCSNGSCSTEEYNIGSITLMYLSLEGRLYTQQNCGAYIGIEPSIFLNKVEMQKIHLDSLGLTDGKENDNLINPIIFGKIGYKEPTETVSFEIEVGVGWVPNFSKTYKVTRTFSNGYQDIDKGPFRIIAINPFPLITIGVGVMI